MQGLFPYFLHFVLPTVMLVFGSLYFYSKKIRQTRSPVNEKMPRPPGESLRQKIEDLDDVLLGWFLLAFMAPIVIGLMFFQSTENQGLNVAVGMLIAYPICLFGVHRMKTALSERRNHWLGFRGERFVGRILDELRTDGYSVFHDIPCDGFNIDHAIVAPAGVFSIETKTRRKKDSGKKDRSSYTVLFDGKVLKFPEWEDSHGVEQALSNARHLAIVLSRATGEKVTAVPVLVLPGWWVESKTLEPVRVLNPKQVLTHVRKQRAVLSAKQISQISYQLERLTEIEF